jgi:NADP-dependent 3-hydroxy acid dehydrogenase YdfG
MSKKWQDKVVWITGASSGIGAALAEEFIKQGAQVALSARRLDRLNMLAKDMGKNAHVYSLDVQKKNWVDNVATHIVNDLGKIDVVVANAGYGVQGKFANLSEEVWRNQFETNFFGVVWTLQAAIPYLKETKGRIAIMSSVAGKLAYMGGAAYSASKFALMGLANALYIELYKSGISVTTIAPGFVESEIRHVDNLGQFKDRPDESRKTFFVWPTKKAAPVMVKAIYDRKREEIITGHGKVAAFLGTHFAPLTYWGMAKATDAP